MYLQKLYLQDFRQFTQATFDFDPQITLITAPNGSGKTTILEAIELLATGKSFRAGKTAEMVRLGQELGRVYGLTDDNLRLGVTVTTGNVGGRRTAGKHFTIDKARKRQKDFVGNLLVTTFRPEDLRLIEGSSSRRRSYLDTPLTLTSPIYLQAHDTYAAVLLRRNKTLKAIKDDGLDPATLNYYDRQLLETGTIIQNYRQDYFDFINNQVPFIHKLQAIYQPNFITTDRLDSHRSAEIAVGHTLVGPHKDNFLIEGPLQNQILDYAIYGSRGQQRLAVLWLKLAELHYLQQKTGRQPLLLLDDIFSELDDTARELVLKQIHQQTTLITSTEANVVKLIGTQIKQIALT